MAEPNLSIIVPGPCNAKCGFCFWKLPPKADKNYIQDLKKTLDSMPEDFHQISLTGGEPTLSYLLPEILKVIDRQKYNKVVLTTNGTALQKFLLNDKDWENFPNHINISRHHFDDAINAEIFNSKSIIDTDKLQSVIQIAHYNNIDVTLNCVLTKHLTYHDDILGFITYAKNVGPMLFVSERNMETLNLLCKRKSLMVILLLVRASVQFAEPRCRELMA